MSDNAQLIPWIQVNRYMEDGYREIVVDGALNQLTKVSGKLKQFARQELLKFTGVPGYRTAYHARSRPSKLRSYIVQEIKREDSLATLVICLWAVEHQSVIEAVQTKAETVGFSIKSDWSWQEAKDGFSELDDISLFLEFVELLAEDQPKPESDHFRLAGLWLNRSIIDQPDLSLDELKALLEEPVCDSDDTADSTFSEAKNVEISPKPVSQEVNETVIAALSNEIQNALVSDETEISSVVGTIVELTEKLTEVIDKETQLKNQTLKHAEVLPELVEVSDFLAIEATLKELQTVLGYWHSAQAVLDKNLDQTRQRLEQELYLRPDLIVDEAFDTLSAPDFLEILKRINQYDHQKSDVIEQLEAVQSEWATIYAELELWLADPDQLVDPFLIDGNLAELSLVELQKNLDGAKSALGGRQSQLSQLRSGGINRIQALLQTVANYDEFDTDQEILDHLSFKQLQASPLDQLSSRQLISLEERLHQQVETLSAEQIKPVNELAQKLQLEWSTENLTDLLHYLATENRDVEVLLLLLSADVVKRDGRRVELSANLVQSLLGALGKLSKQTSPFKLLNLLSTRILSTAKITDPIGQTIFSLAMLGASVDQQFALAEGILWQIGIMDLPVSEMKNWNHLWQTALSDEPLPEILAEGQLDAVGNAFKAAEANLEQTFAFENGVYIRLHSLQSRRHRALLGSELLPKLQGQLDKIKEFQKQADQFPQSLQKNMERLDAEIERLTQVLSEDEIKDDYENGVYQNDINDSSVFLKRTSLRILQESAHSILEYAHQLRNYWDQKLQYQSGLTQKTLLAELENEPQVKSIGIAVLDYLSQRDRNVAVLPNNQEHEAFSSNIIIRELLGNAIYLTRLPHLVAFLVNNKFEWLNLYQPIMTDLINAYKNIDAAMLLMQKEAPNQVQLLVSQLPLEVQKQAQELKSRKEKETSALQTKLLGYMETPATFEKDYALGRWGLLQQQLGGLISEQEARRAEEQRVKEEEAKGIRHKAFELREAIYEKQELIPASAKDHIFAGLDDVMNTADPNLSEQRQGAMWLYLDEIEYRLNNKAWDVQKTREGLEHLRNQIKQASSSMPPKFTVCEVLDIFDEEGDIQELGLDNDQIPPSAVDTRWRILDNWTKVANHPSFLSEDLNTSQRGQIVSLFQHFARMTKLQKIRVKRLKEGPHLAYESPVVYSFWELQYPKTDALRRDCVLIALPGEPPTPSYLRELEDLIEEKQWLDDYAMVLLFAPGCGTAHKKRLSRYKSLVIIDESALIDMVLAERKQRKPIGYLRSMMLNALGAENVDIFKVNQLVNPRTSIFVGRDNLIKRIAGSDGNYVLYGGRRIGKSSVLMEIGNLLEQRGATVLLQSLEGEGDYSDDAIVAGLMRKLRLEAEENSVNEFKEKIQQYLDEDAERKIIFLFDEIDIYIKQNSERHILIEALRALSDRNGSRLRVVVAGFMALHDCLEGKGPYTPNSDPWRRMFNNDGPLPNLLPASAENIAQEGFLEILGWEFERRSIPQLIVKRTGGHPAFVQSFCDKLQRRVANRGDWCVRVSDVKAVFDDDHPDQSFIAYVRHTLKMNLEPIEQYIILYLAQEYKDRDGFTRAQAFEITKLCKASIPPDEVDQSLKRLEITSVVQKRSSNVYEFSVPDYPVILSRLGEPKHLDELEKEIERKYPAQEHVNQ